jgi:signal transduction histidine kinase/CheY-like chemotaxis protein
VERSSGRAEPEAARDALRLARLLAGNRSSGVLSDALDVVLESLGHSVGALLEARADKLELVTERGATGLVVDHIHAVRATEGGLVARAARARKLTVELAEWDEGWHHVAVAPLVCGRRVVGALVVGSPSSFPSSSLAALELAAAIVALSLDRPAPPSDEARGAELVKTEQMAMLGLLVAHVADDLRGPLDVLALQLDEVERLVAQLRSFDGRASEVDSLEDLSVEMRDSVRRLTETASRMLGAVRSSKLERIDLVDVARDAVHLLAPSMAGRGVRLEARLEGSAPVLGRREELHQAFVALLRNGLEAIVPALTRGAGRRHTPPLGRASQPVGQVRFSLSREAGRVIVTVEDSGGGVSQEQRVRIFEPFVTTKPDAVGLGLTLVRQSVLSHKGHIELAQSPLGGALFRLVFPLASGKGAMRFAHSAWQEGRRPARREAGSSSPHLPREGKAAGHASEPPVAVVGRALFIDDNELFVRGLRHALRGWEVSLATTAREAEELLLVRKITPDRIFCDIRLPDGLGHDLHARLVAARPELEKRFVFVTGGVVTPDIADYLMSTGAPILLKPLSLDELFATLERRDDAPPSTLRRDDTRS